MRADHPTPPPPPREKVDLSSAEGLCIHTKANETPVFFVQRKFIFIVVFSRKKARHIMEVYHLNKTKTMFRVDIFYH